MNRHYRLICCFLLIPLTAYAQGGGATYNFVETARLTEVGALDFQFGTAFGSMERSLPSISALGDTVNLAGVSTLRDLRWQVRYGLTPWLEGAVRGGVLFDQNSGASRYGSTDTRAILKFGTGQAFSGSNFAVDVFLQMPTGFTEGQRLVRQFSAGNWAWGTNAYLDFDLRRLSVSINGGFNQNGGTIRTLPQPGTAFWYHGLDQVMGVTDTGGFISTSQYRVGLAAQVSLIGSLRLFTELHTNRLRAQEGEPLSLGKNTIGIVLGDQNKTALRLGIIRPIGTISGVGQMGTAMFFDFRVNGLFGASRRGIAPPPPRAPDTVPALLPGRQPFYRHRNTYFAGTRTPRFDTVFLIDISPSMIGRGLTSERGDNVLADLPSFLTVLVDSLRTGDNVAVISYASGVSSLVWNGITEDKKDEVRRAVNDIPDIATSLVQRIEDGFTYTRPVENLAAALEQAYLELTNFQAGDYNRIHLQRIIHVTDDIADDSLQTQGRQRIMDEIRRKYKVNRDDFRFYYYMQVNQETGRRIGEEITAFVEREDGRIFREVNFGERDELINRLNYNNAANTPVFKYLSQLTKIAVVPFQTNNKQHIQRSLTTAFRSVFDFNEYFVLSEQEAVSRVLQTMSLRDNTKLDRATATRVGRRLGVDFLVTGEIVDFKVRRGSGLRVPYLIQQPTTTLEIAVALEIVDVADGAVVTTQIFNATQDMKRELAFFSNDPVYRMDVLSAVQNSEAMTGLLEVWARSVRDELFLDVLTLNQ